MLNRATITASQNIPGCARVRSVLTTLLVCSVCLGATHDAHAFTKADAATAFTAYNDAFYFTQGTNGYFRATTAGGKTWFWERAEQMEMLLDVYERTTNAACLTMFSNVFNGFLADHGSNWGGNEFNDDIMWMVIACARGYQHTGNPAFRAAACTNFDLCYARAWSTNLGGGLWWKTGDVSKNACVNGPAAIAAHLLYQISGDANYLAKSERIYQWERATLFNTNSGAMYDSIDLVGELDLRTLTYNQGTFIGAANLLGHTNDAKLAADYTMNTICQGRLMPSCGEDGDGGGFNGICARWLAKFMRQRGLERTYQAWLQSNADAHGMAAGRPTIFRGRAGGSGRRGTFYIHGLAAVQWSSCTWCRRRRWSKPTRANNPLMFRATSAPVTKRFRQGCCGRTRQEDHDSNPFDRPADRHHLVTAYAG